MSVDEEEVELLHRLDKLKLQREDPWYNYEGDTYVDELYQPKEEEMDDCEPVPSTTGIR